MRFDSQLRSKAAAERPEFKVIANKLLDLHDGDIVSAAGGPDGTAATGSAAALASPSAGSWEHNQHVAAGRARRKRASCG